MDRNTQHDTHVANKANAGHEIAHNAVTKESKALAKRLKDGDVEAFRMVYMQWYDPINYLLKRIIRNAYDAEDLTQDVFGTLWVQRERIDPDKDVKGLVFSIARKLTSKHIRRNMVQNNYLLSTGFQEETTDSTNEMIFAKELELLTEYIIQKMPVQRREAYLLNLNESLSHSEIARRLNISVKSATDHIYEARKNIKDALAFASLLWLLFIS